MASQAPLYDASATPEPAHARSSNKADAAPPAPGGSNIRMQSSGAASGAWSAQPGMELSTAYALDRIHVAALSLYNFSGEHLEAQSAPRQEDLYGILPLISEINQEIRTLIPVNESRVGRDMLDSMPYYSWNNNARGAAPPYWAPGHADEREGRDARLTDAHPDEKAAVRRAGHSGRGMYPRMAPRASRSGSSSDDLYGKRSGAVPASDPNAPYLGADQNAVYMHQTALAHPKSGGPDVSDDSGQQAYVPKYRKRSRAPAPGVCQSCGSSDTPEWRRGPDGARTLCNACGLHFAKLIRRRTVEIESAPSGTAIPPVTIAELRASAHVGGAAPSDSSMSMTSPRSADMHQEVSKSDSSAPPGAASFDALAGRPGTPQATAGASPAGGSGTAAR